eukprot:12010414-Alexandrium_andersonii.AAC.1
MPLPRGALGAPVFVERMGSLMYLLGAVEQDGAGGVGPIVPSQSVSSAVAERRPNGVGRCGGS